MVQHQLIIPPCVVVVVVMMMTMMIMEALLLMVTFFKEANAESTCTQISPARSNSMRTKSSTGWSSWAFLFVEDDELPTTAGAVLLVTTPGVEEVSCCHKSKIGPNCDDHDGKVRTF